MRFISAGFKNWHCPPQINVTPPVITAETQPAPVTAALVRAQLEENGQSLPVTEPVLPVSKFHQLVL